MLRIPSQFPARSIPACRKGMLRKELASLGTRVQFPPPPLFVYKRQQATVGVRPRLNLLIARGLRRIRIGPISAKERQQATARVPGALPKALPAHYLMTQIWP